MAGLAVAVPDISDSAMMQMPCHTEALQYQTTNHSTDDEEACTMDCCNTDEGCSVDLSCLSCLNLHFVNAMLFEVRGFCFFPPSQSNPDVVIGHIPNRPILPEIHPPDSFYLS